MHETRFVGGRREGKGREKVTEESHKGDSFADFAGAKSTRAIGGSRAAKDWSVDSGFKAFRATYPKTDKAPARTYRAWLSALKKSPVQTIIAAIGSHPFSDDEHFRPDPATWLNGESWRVTGHRPATASPGVVNGGHHAPGVVCDASGAEVTLERAAALGL